jgi:proteasome alpha subunit
VGADRGEIDDYLEAHYSDDMTLEDGVELALGALASVQEDGLEPEGLSLATVPVETASYRVHDDDEVAGYIDEFDLGPTEDESDDADDAE